MIFKIDNDDFETVNELLTSDDPLKDIEKYFRKKEKVEFKL